MDPELKICNNPSNNNLFSAFPSIEIYTWLGNGNFGHCEQLNTCFCKACGVRDEKFDGRQKAFLIPILLGKYKMCIFFLSIFIYIFLGIMVIGGMINGKGTSSTELLIDNTHRCYLPEIPEDLYGHSLISTDGSNELESFLLCGGRGRKHHYKS